MAGFSPPMIDTLRKASLIVDAIERLTGTETSLDTVNEQIGTVNELIEDANLTLETLDARLDDQEAGNGPYVKKTGDTMSGSLNVNDLLECDSFKINVSPTAETIVCTHTLTIAVGAANYKIPMVAA